MNWYDSAVKATEGRRMGLLERMATRKVPRTSEVARARAVIYFLVLALVVIFLTTVGFLIGAIKI